jgi:hypothetical protein
MAYISIQCPLCDFSSKIEKKLFTHLSTTHNIDAELAYIKYKKNGVKVTCRCGCGKVPKWYGWKKGHSKYYRGHNARDYTTFTDKTAMKQAVSKRKSGYESGKYKVWNKGLSKNNSEKVRQMSEKTSKTLTVKYKTGELVSWQTGLTKDTDERLLRSSQTKKRKYSSGETTSWNKGLTKETDHRIAAVSKKISESYKLRIAGKRLSEEEVSQRIKGANFTFISGEYKTRKKSKLYVKCNVCEKDQYRTLYSIDESLACFYCQPKESKAQLEINDFILSLGIETILSDRDVLSPKELDIYIPSKNVAIEYNGLFWHSERYLQKEYHSDKTEKCNEKNIQLIHIFEDEWRDKKEIVKSLLRNKLGVGNNRIYARKCEVKQVSTKDRKIFFNENHIDGDTRSKIAFGLYYDDQLVSCLSLRKPFHKKWKDYYEVSRSATAKNITVIGGLSKLSKTASRYAHLSDKKGLLSYVDTHYGNGNGYKKSGYTHHSTTGNMFWWTDNVRRYNRFKIRADSKNSLSESEVAKKENMIRIYGCKNLVFLYD